MGTTMVAIKGGGLVEKAVADLLRYTKRTVKGPVLKVSPNASSAKKMMVFNVGRSKNLKGKGAEYARQIQRQIDGLNKMSASDILRNIDAFNAAKGAGKATRDPKLARKVRGQASERIHDREYEKAVAAGLSPSEASQVAAARTQAMMKTRALLHEPDGVVGGADRFGGPQPSLGNTHVNSSLGGQMRHMQDEVRAHVLEMVRKGRGSESPQIAWILGSGR